MGEFAIVGEGRPYADLNARSPQSERPPKGQSWAHENTEPVPSVTFSGFERGGQESQRGVTFRKEFR
jgi:hypothetical protein